jgi:hypothetical protein
MGIRGGKRREKLCSRGSSDSTFELPISITTLPQEGQRWRITRE